MKKLGERAKNQTSREINGLILCLPAAKVARQFVFSNRQSPFPWRGLKPLGTNQAQPLYFICKELVVPHRWFPKSLTRQGFLSFTFPTLSFPYLMAEGEMMVGKVERKQEKTIVRDVR